jgi:hypothetical protein
MSVVNPIPKPAHLNTRYNPTFPGHFFQFPGIFCKPWLLRAFSKPSLSKPSLFQIKSEAPLKHDQDVIEMNEVHRRASEWVQRRTHKVAP